MKRRLKEIADEISGEDFVASARGRWIYVCRNNGAFTTEKTDLPGFATFLHRFTREEAEDYLENGGV